MKELGQRVVVALVAAPVALGAIWFGDAALTTLLSIAAAIGAWEYCRIAREAGHAPLTWPTVVLSACVPLAVHARFLGLVVLPTYSLLLVLVALMALTLLLRPPTAKPLGALATSVLGIGYTGGTLSVAYALRYFGYAIGETAGALVVVLPVLLTWASDIGAYFTGRLIGGRKLMPSVSPGKTVSGAIGGVGFTVLVAVVLVRVALRPYAQLGFSPLGIVLYPVAISVTAQVGDLFESLLKREAGVKDSGTVLPGHGGVLDRLDSLFFVLPVSYALYDWLLIPAPH